MKKLLLLLIILCANAQAQDITLLGGATTTTDPLLQENQNAIQATAPNVKEQTLKDIQTQGFTVFHTERNKETGLGPHFVNRGCSSCHIQNGRGSTTLRKSALVIKVAEKNKFNEDGSPVDLENVGEQLQHRSIKNRKRFRIRIKYRKIRRQYKDGESIILRRPLIQFRVKKYKKRDIGYSLRMTPMIFGVGLLESIPEEQILALSDPEDSNNDGISGKPNYVTDQKAKKLSLGRFGYKASHPTVEQQSAAASFLDMGISNPIFKENEEEMTEKELFLLTMYQKLASVPSARTQDNENVQKGKILFQEFGCNDCHVMKFTTKNKEIPELDNQTIFPFTDLLLHDMGSGLADTRPEFSATNREFRTTPLWGLGFSIIIAEKFGVKPRFLHDGRARTLEEAIFWHNGEALSSKNAFRNANKEQREQLIYFLRSL